MKADSNTIDHLSGNAKADSAYHTLEWLITAFAGTLVFIFFVMQVYRIPTGSMAETLRGAHFRLRCSQCGFRYDYDYSQHIYSRLLKVGQTDVPNQDVPVLPERPRCPSCGFHEPPVKMSAGQMYLERGGKPQRGLLRTVFKGDQIFVLKCIYQFFEPKRWDVIVFKNPLEPKINYIKRLIAKPGETLQIIDGDIYIDGLIQRKPSAAQEELWTSIYQHDYQPIYPAERGYAGGATWRVPFEPVGDSRWQTAGDGLFVMTLDAQDSRPHRLRYNPQIGNGFRAAYAYNDASRDRDMPICSDLMTRCRLTLGARSAFGARLSKYGIGFEGWVEASGAMRLVRIGLDGAAETLAETTGRPQPSWAVYQFSNADHLLRLAWGDAVLEYDLGRAPDALGGDRAAMPAAELLGIGSVRLRHVGLFRDIHYLDGLQGTEEKPITLGKDEFFACGDNSPFSYDSRLWNKPGIGNRGKTYRQGIVPREYLVGKALFAHWPGGWRIKSEPLRWIPAPDGMKFIYGGKDD